MNPLVLFDIAVFTDDKVYLRTFARYTAPKLALYIASKLALYYQYHCKSNKVGVYQVVYKSREQLSMNLCENINLIWASWA